MDTRQFTDQDAFDHALAREQVELDAAPKRPGLTLRVARVTGDAERRTITGEFEIVPPRDAIDADFRVIDPDKEAEESRKQLPLPKGTDKE